MKGKILTIAAILLMTLSLSSCKKEVSECKCGKITEYYQYHLNGQEWEVPIPISYTTKPKVNVKNNCSGEEKTFNVDSANDVKYSVGNTYCDNKSW